MNLLRASRRGRTVAQIFASDEDELTFWIETFDKLWLTTADHAYKEVLNDLRNVEYNSQDDPDFFDD